MARRKLFGIIRYLQQLTGSASGSSLGDAELLERYVRHGDEAAFELLLWRHGVLVLNVCRRVLNHEDDIEDAFQATFLTFVRKAPAIVQRGSVASWLYKVAYRVALEARARRRKTAAREQGGGASWAVQVPADATWDDLRPILDEELSRLPERLRRPVVLCYLEGKTNEEAARELGCPAGTIYSRLSRGRDLLRHRLLRRGVALSAAALSAALAEHAAHAIPTVPLVTMTRRAALFFAAGQAAGARVSPRVTTLAEGVLRTMLVSKLKMAALMLLVFGLLAAGGAWTQHALKAAPEPEGRKEPPATQANNAQKGEEDKVAVHVVHPKAGGFQLVKTMAGRIRAAAQQQVYPAVSGYLKQLKVDIGDRVKKGDFLAEIDAPLLVMDFEQAQATYRLAEGQLQEAKARVATAEAELEAAKRRITACEAKLNSDKANLAFRDKQLKRFQDLFRERSIDARLVDEQEDRREAAFEAVNASQEALATARANLPVRQSQINGARAALASAEANLHIAQAVREKARLQVDFTQIRANFDGVVTWRNVNVGDYVTSGEPGTRRPLLTVQRIDTVRAVVEVADTDAPLTRPGIEAKVRADALPGVDLPDCKVSRTGFAVDLETGRMPVEIDIPNPKDLLRPGMFVKVSLHFDAPVNSVLVPRSCLVGEKDKDEDTFSVYVVRDNKAHLTPVRVGHVVDRQAEILSGLKASDIVVIDPKGLKGDVVPVEVKKAP
jgi:RND family efflux transporter MFP subunit